MGQNYFWPKCRDVGKSFAESESLVPSTKPQVSIRNKLFLPQEKDMVDGFQVMSHVLVTRGVKT